MWYTYTSKSTVTVCEIYFRGPHLNRPPEFPHAVLAVTFGVPHKQLRLMTARDVQGSLCKNLFLSSKKVDIKIFNPHFKKKKKRTNPNCEQYSHWATTIFFFYPPFIWRVWSSFYVVVDANILLILLSFYYYLYHIYEVKIYKQTFVKWLKSITGTWEKNQGK